MIIIDGLGDRPSRLLEDATPLEAAHTPNLDRLVSEGYCGQVDPFIAAMPVGTHTGTALLMGMAPGQVYTLSRGPVEARGSDAAIGPDDVALRGNFATLQRGDHGFAILDRRAGRIHEGTDRLAAALRDIDLGQGVKSNIYPVGQHRSAVVLSGPQLSENVSDTDPGHLNKGNGVLKCTPLDGADTMAVQTSEAINQFIERAFEILQDHPVNRQRNRNGLAPANGIITRGAGKIHNFQGFLRQLGLSVSLVAGGHTVLGLADLLHYDTLTAPEFTALPDTDLDAKVAAAFEKLKSYDLVYLHIKGTDICAHDKDARGKLDFISRIDKAIAPLIGDEIVIGVTADHSTDSTSGRHTGDPVPSLVRVPGGRRDGCRKFGESECMRGGLGRISSHTFLLTFLDGVGVLRNYRPSDMPFVT